MTWQALVVVQTANHLNSHRIGNVSVDRQLPWSFRWNPGFPLTGGSITLWFGTGHSFRMTESRRAAKDQRMIFDYIG
jgi:hypothetical protein